MFVGIAYVASKRDKVLTISRKNGMENAEPIATRTTQQKAPAHVIEGLVKTDL